MTMQATKTLTKIDYLPAGAGGKMQWLEERVLYGQSHGKTIRIYYTFKIVDAEQIAGSPFPSARQPELATGNTARPWPLHRDPLGRPAPARLATGPARSVCDRQDVRSARRTAPPVPFPELRPRSPACADHLVVQRVADHPRQVQPQLSPRCFPSTLTLGTLLYGGVLLLPNPIFRSGEDCRHSILSNSQDITRGAF